MIPAKDGGGAAFPVGNGNALGHGAGMSLRDWFAGQALAGLCATMPRSTFDGISEGVRGGRFYSEIAFTLADNMLEQRAK